MKYVVTVLLAFLFLGYVSPTYAQQETPSNYKHLKVVGGLIGEWQAVIEVGEDSPDGKIKKGQKIHLHLSLRWTANKNAIQDNLTIKLSGVTIFSWTRLLGWHAGDKKLISGGFDSKGGSGMATWQRKGNDWHIVGKGVDGNGKAQSGTTVLSEISENSFVSQSINRTRDGEKQPDAQKIMWKRVK